jgi:hypothetical protein
LSIGLLTILPTLSRIAAAGAWSTFAAAIDRPYCGVSRRFIVPGWDLIGIGTPARKQIQERHHELGQSSAKLEEGFQHD